MKRSVTKTSAPFNKLTTALVLLLAALQPACVAVGYSNRGGWFVWPGGLGLLLLIVVVLLFLRRRR